MLYRFIVLMYCFLITNPIFSKEEDPTEDLIPSTPDQLAALSAKSDYLIGGLVSPLSGQLVLRQTDLIVKGTQNIILSRTYIPTHIPTSFPKNKHQKHNKEAYAKKALYYHIRDNYQGWQFNSHLRLQLNETATQVRLSEPSGITFDFQLSGPNRSIATLASLPFALSNTVGDAPSGQYDPRNTRISYDDAGKKITVYATDGSVRIYNLQNGGRRYFYLYLLTKEILASGKILRYHYNKEEQLTLIESLDPQERYIYASLSMTGSPQHTYCHFTSSSGLAVDYIYQKRSIKWEIKEKDRKSVV